PDLGSNFSVIPINQGNEAPIDVTEGGFDIYPGTYILTKKGKTLSLKPESEWGRGRLNDFTAPASTVDKTWVLHQPVQEASADTPFKISAEIVSGEEIVKVQAWLHNGNSYESIDLRASNAYEYSAEIPEELLRHGFLNYSIIVTTAEETY